MSKVVFICHKDPSATSAVLKSIDTITERITPNNIQPNPTIVEETNGVIKAIFNPMSLVEEASGAVLLGKLFGESRNWNTPGFEIQDGSFALFRSDDQYFELLTDVVGSRSIWYYEDDDQVIASTSQRAIVMLLGTFQFNDAVLPWLFSTGSLGPNNSWDKRIKLLPPDSVYRLDRNNWTSLVSTKPIVFRPSQQSETEHEANLRNSLNKTFSAINLNYKQWNLPLSGGFDSRGILCLLKAKSQGEGKIKAITWGLESALHQKGNDASVAKELAEHFEIDHKYYLTDPAKESLEEVLNRYIVCGEGRVDHVNGYMDGFRIWKTLFEDGVQGIIRGDEGFGWTEVDSVFTVLREVGLPLCSNYANLEHYESLGFPKQELPAELKQQEGESLAAWRDRLYHQFRLPTILSALTDLKVSYVEILNPLLSKECIYQTRTLPDNLRTNKTLFKKIIKSLSPPIDYAHTGANADKEDILRSEQIVAIIRQQLRSEAAQKIFPETFIQEVSNKLKIWQQQFKKKTTLKSLLKRYMPKWMKQKAVRMAPKLNVDSNLLGFRTYMASKMVELLTEDATVSHELVAE